MHSTQVLDVSGASLLADTLPGSQVDLLDNCGHSVVMERPRKAANLIMDFITRQQNSGNASSKKLSWDYARKDYRICRKFVNNLKCIFLVNPQGLITRVKLTLVVLAELESETPMILLWTGKNNRQ